RREEARQRKAAQKRNQIFQRIGIGLAAILFIAGFIFVSSQNRGSQGDLLNLQTINADNIDGSPDAPVIITEFGDFGCPACRQWHLSGIKERIQESFGEDVTFVFRHFPVITLQSPKAAEAGQCAAEQGGFWPYHDYIYEQGSGLNDDQLVAYAGQVGLDMTIFETCLDSGRYEDYVEADMRLARDVGARGTPTFLVNNQLVAAPTLSILTNAIREELE
ncbi:MAG: thioredoxin domain-containing protein, partial [Chloroflexota bacterium]